jgi:hypothetical protein
MNPSRSLPILSLVLVLGAAMLAPAPASASADRKMVQPSACQAYGPDTTISELDLSAAGIYNPGTTIERVICPLPRDQESAYTSGQLVVGIYYRVLGAAATTVTCTLTVGSTSMQSAAVYTHTASGPTVKSGARSSYQFTTATQSNEFLVVPTSVTCAIPPKTSLGAIYFAEGAATQVP